MADALPNELHETLLIPWQDLNLLPPARDDALPIELP